MHSVLRLFLPIMCRIERETIGKSFNERLSRNGLSANVAGDTCLWFWIKGDWVRTIAESKDVCINNEWTIWLKSLGCVSSRQNCYLAKETVESVFVFVTQRKPFE